MSEKKEMLPTNKSNDQVSYWSRLLGKTAAWILGLATLLGLGFGAVSWYEAHHSKPIVTVDLIEYRCLTKYEKIDSLEGRFFYQGRQINDLWEIVLRCRNGCNRNIIGREIDDLMSSNISFVVSAPFRILSLKSEHQNDKTFSLSNHESDFALSFVKWHPSDVCDIRMYCEAKEPVSGMRPLISVVDEPLKQGEVVLRNEFDSSRDERLHGCSLLFNKIPYGVRIVPQWVSMIVLFLVFGGCIYLLAIKTPWLSMWRLYRWRKAYEGVFACQRSVNTNESFNLLLALQQVDENFWESSGIPRPQIDLAALGEIPASKTGFYVTVVFLFLISIVAITAILALIEL